MSNRAWQICFGLFFVGLGAVLAATGGAWDKLNGGILALFGAIGVDDAVFRKPAAPKKGAQK